MGFVAFYDYHEVFPKRGVKGKLGDPDGNGGFNILCEIKCNVIVSARFILIIWMKRSNFVK
jgi:hypothetical protein